MAMIVRGLVGFALVAQGETASQKGQEVHCINNRAHLLQYDVEGEENDGSSLTGVRQAIISMDRSLDHADHCSKPKLGVQLGDHTPTGEKEFCYGANEDASCKAAKSDMPLKDGFVCKNCFVSAEADAFYKLNYTMTHLNSVEVGLKNINLRASAVLQKLQDGTEKVASGTLQFPDSDKEITLIDRLVGCPVCVKVTIKVKFPTSLDYSVTFTEDANLDAGAGLDIDLGNNIIKYDSANATKWSHQFVQVDQAKVTATPALSADMKATADLKLDVKTSLQVNVDNIIWYHLNMAPSIDTKVSFEEKNLFHEDRVCMDGDAALTMNQEADLNWDLKIWRAKDHWGPKDIFTWSKDGVLKGCKDINPKSDAIIV